MSNLVRWEPFRDLTDFRNSIDRVFDRGYARPWRVVTWENGGSLFPVDVSDTEDSVVVTASLPGVTAEDINVSITGTALTIKGETKSEETAEEANYYRQERRSGGFERSIRLPVRVEAAEASATFENGVLTLDLPKAADVKTQTIEIKAKKASASAS
jgi:HSP20 family protein